MVSELVGAKNALALQVEQLQNLLLLESGRVSHVQNSSDLSLSAITAELNEQKQQLQQQLMESAAHSRQLETRLHTITQQQQDTSAALTEALREAAAASAIEQHIKTKLSTAQNTIFQQKMQMEQQHATAAAERERLDRLLLDKDAALQDAQVQAAELRQRYHVRLFTR